MWGWRRSQNRVSKRTIRRRMKQSGLRKTGLYSAVNDEELDRILSEVHRRHPNTGYKLMRGHLNARGVRVPSDKGYPPTEYLINPLANPATDQERRFNSTHTRRRVTVERCFGLLKGRWLCLGPAGGTLLYTPEKVCNIILACSVLYNIALVNGLPFDVPAQPDEPMPMEPWPVQPPLGAIRRRQDLICRF